jgi:hypothetical protein
MEDSGLGNDNSNGSHRATSFAESSVLHDMEQRHQETNPFETMALDAMGMEERVVAPLPANLITCECDEKSEATTAAAPVEPTSAPLSKAGQPADTTETMLPSSNSTSQLTFYAIRKGVGIKGPAIFTSLDDAKPFCTTSSKDEEQVEYCIFHNIQEALQYLQIGENTAAQKRKSTTTVTSPKAKKRKYTHRNLANRIKQSEFDKIMASLQEFKEQYHHVNVPGPFSKKVHIDEKFSPLTKTMAMVRNAVKQYKEDPKFCPLTDHQMTQLADIGFVPRTMLVDNDTNKQKRGTIKEDSSISTNTTSRWQTPTSAHNLLKLRTELEDSWENCISLLKDYKAEVGHAKVPRRPNKSLDKKYLPLCKFAGWMTKFLEEYKESPDKTHFFLNTNRVVQLEELGFATTSPTRKINARQELLTNVNFDTMLMEMKGLREMNAPIKTNRQLEWWIAEQRKEYAAFKNNQPSSLTPEKVAAMAEAGFPFEKMKSPTWDERAVEWLEFKTRMGRDPMREESLYQWVYKQRIKYKQKTEGKKNNLTEEQIKRLTDWGFTWEMKFQFPNMARPVPWEERFQQLLKFKEENGNCQVHKNIPILGQWVKQQRKEYRFFVQGSKNSRMTQERIAKLSSIGFDFGEKRWNTGKMKTAHAAIEKGKQQDQHIQEQGQQQQQLLFGTGAAGDSDNEDSGFTDPSSFQHFQQGSLTPWDGYRTFSHNI